VNHISTCFPSTTPTTNGRDDFPVYSTNIYLFVRATGYKASLTELDFPVDDNILKVVLEREVVNSQEYAQLIAWFHVLNLKDFSNNYHMDRYKVFEPEGQEWKYIVTFLNKEKPGSLDDGFHVRIASDGTVIEVIPAARENWIKSLLHF